MDNNTKEDVKVIQTILYVAAAAIAGWAAWQAWLGAEALAAARRMITGQ